jgi:NADH-quinone oxidoreductase subunit M
MAFFLIVFTLSSIGLPGLNGFVSEFLVLLGTATSNTVTDGLAPGPLHYGYVVPAATGIILGAVYMLWMCQRLLFGPLNQPPHTPDTSAGLTPDLTRREIAILAPIALVCLLIGVFPKPVLDTMQPAIARNILHAEPTTDIDRQDSALAVLSPASGGHDSKSEHKRRLNVRRAEAGVPGLIGARPGAWAPDEGWIGAEGHTEGKRPG